MEFFVIYEKYTYSRVKNRFLSHHKCWAIFLRCSAPRGPSPRWPEFMKFTFFVIKSCSIPLDPFSREEINEKCPRIMKTKVRPPLAHLNNTNPLGGGGGRALGSPK